MKPARTFNSVVTELITGLRSGDIALDAPRMETEASHSMPEPAGANRLLFDAAPRDAKTTHPGVRDFGLNKSKGD
jgi:hypothetical protein